MTVIQFPSNNVAVSQALKEWGDKLHLEVVEADDGSLSISAEDKLGRRYVLVPASGRNEWELMSYWFEALGSFKTPSEALTALAN